MLYKCETFSFFKSSAQGSRRNYTLKCPLVCRQVRAKGAGMSDTALFMATSSILWIINPYNNSLRNNSGTTRLILNRFEIRHFS